MAILNRTHRRITGALAALAVSALMISACASGSGSGSESGGGEGGASGEPILIGGLGEVTGSVAAYPGIPRLLEERFKEINDAGGVGGRPLELAYCDTQGVADQVTRCLRDLEGKGVVFLLSEAVIAGADKVPPIVEAAGLPYSSAAALNPVDYKSPMSFTVITYLAATIGAAQLAASDGCKNMVAFSYDTPSLQFSKDMVALGVEAGGGGKVTWVTPPLNTTDWAPIAQQITDINPDCLLPYSSETVNALLYPALEQSGWKEKGKDNRLVGYMGGVYTTGNLAEFPEFLEGTRVVDLTPPTSDPRWDDYNAIIDRLRSENIGNLGSSFLKNTYVNLEVLMSAIKILQERGDDVTRENLVDVYSNETLDAGGYIDPFVAESIGIEEWPRMFNARYVLEQIGPDGTIELVNGSDMVDFSEELKEAAEGQ